MSGPFPDEPGTYLVIDELRRPLYVGFASNLRARATNHQRSPWYSLLAKRRKLRWFYVLNDVEPEAIRDLRPKLNKMTDQGTLKAHRFLRAKKRELKGAPLKNDLVWRRPRRRLLSLWTEPIGVEPSRRRSASENSGDSRRETGHRDLDELPARGSVSIGTDGDGSHP
jgi:hypothetical protein